MNEINLYLHDKITLIQLFKLAENKCIQVATKKQITEFLSNSFMLSVLADEHKIELSILKYKLELILSKL